MAFKFNTRVIYTLVSAVIILAGTVAAIKYAKGQYRVTPQGIMTGTGLLNANSFPTGAEVQVDGRLVTATDDTIYLEPGDYEVMIAKDGYSPWRKKLSIEAELVTQTNAQLFRVAPSLTPLTFTGVNKLFPSPDGQKILYYAASSSASPRNGLYVIELTTNPLALSRGTRQIAADVPSLKLDQSQAIWSPDSSQVLLITPEKEMLISTDSMNNLDQLTDVSLTKKTILAGWEEEMYLRERQFLDKFPPEMISVATQSAVNVYLSPDKKRLVYTATQAITLPEDLIPPIPARNSQNQVRNLRPGMVYVYDREEDTNFEIGTTLQASPSGEMVKQLLATDLNQPAMSLVSSPTAFLRLQASDSATTAELFNRYHSPVFHNGYQWFPDSKHLLFVNDQRIKIVSYDTTNETVLYNGPFESQFVYPWPDGSQILILASFSTGSPPNLYALEIK